MLLHAEVAEVQRIVAEQRDRDDDADDFESERAAVAVAERDENRECDERDERGKRSDDGRGALREAEGIDDVVGEYAGREVLVDADEEHHACMEAEGADTHRGEHVVDEFQQDVMRGTHLIRVVDILRCTLVRKCVHDEQGDGRHDGVGQAGVEVRIDAVIAEALEEEGREQQGNRRSERAAVLFCRNELRLLGSDLRHLCRQRRARNHDGREDHLVDHVRDQVEQEGMARRPEDRIGDQDERCAGQDEQAPTAELAADPRAAHVIGNEAHDRVADRIDQACDRKDKSCLYGRDLAGRRVEQHQERRGQRLRAATEEVQACIAQNVPPGNFPCFHDFCLPKQLVAQVLFTLLQCLQNRVILRYPP